MLKVGKGRILFLFGNLQINMYLEGSGEKTASLLLTRSFKLNERNVGMKN